MALNLTYAEYEDGEVIYHEGDEPKNVYMILKGSVANSQKNPRIDSWDWAYSNYEALMKWKKNEFDRKVSKIKQLNSIKSKLLADVK